MGEAIANKLAFGRHQETESGPPPVLGDRLPEIRLIDHRKRRKFLSQSLRGKGALLLFMPNAWDPIGQAMLRRFAEVHERLEPFVDVYAITRQPAAKNAGAATQLNLPFAICTDPDGKIARDYDVKHNLVAEQPVMGMAAFSAFLADINGRILHIARNSADSGLANTIVELLEAEAAEAPREMGSMAPVLFVPRVFDPDFCQRLMDAYENGDKMRSGTLRDMSDGRREHHIDDEIKIRHDHAPEGELLDEIWEQLQRRLVPEIYKAFHFEITRYDSFKIGCYDGETGGHFAIHRDNDSPSGMHRRFAMSLNLNTGDYEGGYLRFPEHGPHLYRPGPGEAVIFSCSLLHEATPVTKGTRFVLLGFLFGEEDQKILNRRVRKIKTTRAGEPGGHRR